MYFWTYLLWAICRAQDNTQTVKATVHNADSAVAVTFLYWWIHISSFLLAYTSSPKPVFPFRKAKIYTFQTLYYYGKQLHFKRPLSFLYLLPVTPLLGRVDLPSSVAEQSYHTGKSENKQKRQLTTLQPPKELSLNGKLSIRKWEFGVLS